MVSLTSYPHLGVELIACVQNDKEMKTTYTSILSQWQMLWNCRPKFSKWSTFILASDCC